MDRWSHNFEHLTQVWVKNLCMTFVPVPEDNLFKINQKISFFKNYFLKKD